MTAAIAAFSVGLAVGLVIGAAYAYLREWARSKGFGRPEVEQRLAKRFPKQGFPFRD